MVVRFPWVIGALKTQGLGLWMPASTKTKAALAKATLAMLFFKRFWLDHGSTRWYNFLYFFHADTHSIFLGYFLLLYLSFFLNLMAVGRKSRSTWLLVNGTFVHDKNFQPDDKIIKQWNDLLKKKTAIGTPNDPGSETVEMTTQ